MRFWESKAYQACKIGECVKDGPPFPGGLSVGTTHTLPVYVPSENELAEVSLKPVNVSSDSANSKILNATFRKRSVRQRGVLFSQMFVWGRLS